MRLKSIWAAGILSSLLLFLFNAAAFAQCAMCKTALSSEEGRRLAEGFYWSILVMLSAPYVMVAVIAALLFNAYRRRPKRPPMNPERN